MLLPRFFLAFASVGLAQYAPPTPREPPSHAPTLVRRIRASEPTYVPTHTWTVSGAASTSKSLDPATYVSVTCKNTGAYNGCIQGAADSAMCCLNNSSDLNLCATQQYTDQDNCEAIAAQSVPCASMTEKEECCSALFTAYLGSGGTGCDSA
ncbi:hypothetical protein JCM10207_005271 [Rhodosporidiobolus poonsookiae]